MKKMFGLIIVLLMFYLIAQAVYQYTTGGFSHHYRLLVGKDYYHVKETFTRHHLSLNKRIKDIPSYYYEINKENDELFYSFKLLGNYMGTKNYLEDLKVYEEGKMICIYPIFTEHNNQLDIICSTGEEQFNYIIARHKNDNIINFINDLQEEGYDHYSWHDEEDLLENFEKIKIYSENFVSEQRIIIWNYKGIYVVSKGLKKIHNFLKQDHYKNNLGVMIDQYYIVPKYLKDGYFEEMEIINILTSTSSSEKLNYQISNNSFIQGVINNLIYIIDKDNQIQYEFNLDTKKMIIMGNKKITGRHYLNGKWVEKGIKEIIDEELVFQEEIEIPSSLKEYNAYKIDSVLGETDGYYYLYKKVNEETEVYRIDKQNIAYLTLLFKIPSIEEIKYVEDKIYFLNDDTLYVYSDSLGLRPLVKYNEFIFNKNRIYDVFERKN